MPLLKRQRPLKSVTAFFAHSAAGREERYRGGREVPLGEDLIEPGLRQERAQCSDTCGADHRAPCTREVVIGEPFQHQHFGNRIDFRAAQNCRELQPKHSRASQRRDRLGSKHGQFFALAAGLLQGGADLIDAGEQQVSFRLPVLRKCLDRAVLRRARSVEHLQIQFPHLAPPSTGDAPLRAQKVPPALLEDHHL